MNEKDALTGVTVFAMFLGIAIYTKRKQNGSTGNSASLTGISDNGESQFGDGSSTAAQNDGCCCCPYKS
jgi:hypothetical protein